MISKDFFDSYGVIERLRQNDEIDELVAELLINGFAVLPGGFPAEFVESLKDSLDLVYAQQIVEIGSESELTKMNDADIVRCALSYHPDFLKVATAEPLLELCRRFLGPEFILLMQNGIINRPDRENQQAKWHRDLNYQHWTCSKPLAINALFCVDEFTIDNGATFVLPGTHNVAEFPTDRFTVKFERQLTAPAGAYLILDAMVFHRAGINRSGAVRRAVNHVIGLPFMAQQVDIPSAIAQAGGDPPSDPQIRRFLNYLWSPSADATSWRRRRLVP